MVWIKIKRALSWPLMQITHLLKWILSRIMLQACEVAQEYMLSLIYAPQVGTFVTIIGLLSEHHQIVMSKNKS